MEIILNTSASTILTNALKNGSFNLENFKNLGTLTDLIFFGLTNSALWYISALESPARTTLINRMNDHIQAVYYPLGSGLLFGAYNSVMYNNSYIAAMSLYSPLIILESYLNYKYIEEKKTEVKEEVNIALNEFFGKKSQSNLK